MDQQNSVIQPQPSDQINQTAPNIQPKKNWYKYGFWALTTVLFISTIIVGVFLYAKSHNLSILQPNTLPDKLPYVTNIPLNKQPTTINKTKTFIDSRLEGMTFDYDPTMWNARYFNNNDEEIMNEFKNTAPGTILREIGGNGRLLIYYTVSVGQGGGILLFGNGDVVNLSDTIARVKIQGEYLYGAEKNLVSFDTSPDEKSFLIKTCDEGPNPVIDETGCTYIKSGQAVGYVNQPAFNYSFKLKRNIPLAEFGFEQFENVAEDKENLIIVINYQGKNPEEADKIIKQIVQHQ